MIRKLVFVDCFSYFLLKSFGNFINVIRLNPLFILKYTFYFYKKFFTSMCWEYFLLNPKKAK